MTRLGVISDSHDRGYWLEKWLEYAKKQKYDAVFHLGDYDSDARWLKKRLDAPMFCVAGNCDMFSKLPRMARAAYGPHRLLAVHGHLQDVKYGYDKLCWYAEEQNATIALFGHTHVPYASMEGGILLMNPGALMDGRYGELTLDGDRAVPRLETFRDDWN